MSFGISVKGGTGAGTKKPLLPAYTIPWRCGCFQPDEAPKLNPGYLKRCIDCGTSRDSS